MATVTVNGKPIDIGSDRLNCIEAAQRAGVEVPHYCWHPDLTVVASCRMCLVEVGDKKPDGTVAMQPKVVPGCQTLVKDGNVIVTDSPKAKAAQASTLEGLLINHPLDCPVCDKAGECKLQDYSFEFGNARSRMVDDKNTPPNKPDISSKIALFTDRCVMCSRCVRFTREFSGEAELQVVSRGHHSEIDVFPGRPLENKLSGNVVDLCPVGALGSKDFLYKQRVWFLQSNPSVCPNCSTGCSVTVDTNKDIVFRLKARPNPEAQGSFMCDEGRWGYHYANDKKRLGRPLIRKDGKMFPAAYSEWMAGVKKELADAAKSGDVWVVLSPFATVEEAFLLAKFVKGVSPKAKLAMGPIPVVGDDDRYPKDRRGNPPAPEKARFVIRAEKCPNRLGVAAVLGREARSFDEAVSEAKAGKVKALVVLGGYPRPDWLSGDDASAFASVPLRIVGDLFAGPATAGANFVFPATTFAEKDGSYVNHAGLAQSLTRAVKPPQEARPELQLFSELLGRKGLIKGATVREELAKEVPAFASLPALPVETGSRLSLN